MTILPISDSDYLAPVRTHFDPTTGYVVVQLSKIDYGFTDRPVRYQRRVFLPKEELHITVISQAAAEAVLKYLMNGGERQGSIEDLITETSWAYRKLDEYYHVESEPGVESIIQMVEMPGLDPFFRSLSRMVSQGISLPPTHVTLYTRNTEEGIGLPDQTVFKERVRSSLQPEEIQLEEDHPGGAPGYDQGLA